MNKEEITHILTAILVFTIILSFGKLINQDYAYIQVAFVGAAVVIVTNIFGKKITANLLDSDVTHRLWFSEHVLHKSLKKPFPSGVVIPLILSLITSGFIKFTSFLEYETSAKKFRAAKRFGYYSYAEMTDWHNAVIGAGGMLVTFIVLCLTYFTNFEPISKAAAFYMFWNMIPICNTDGTQILFGSRTLWVIFSILALLSSLYAIALV